MPAEMFYNPVGAFYGIEEIKGEIRLFMRVYRWI